MSRVDDEIDSVGDKSGVPGAHQLFRRLRLTSAIDNWLATRRKSGTGTARARLIIFSHRPQLTQIFQITQDQIW
jgi:hypothetical protein